MAVFVIKNIYHSRFIFSGVLFARMNTSYMCIVSMNIMYTYILTVHIQYLEEKKIKIRVSLISIIDTIVNSVYLPKWIMRKYFYFLVLWIYSLFLRVIVFFCFRWRKLFHKKSVKSWTLFRHNYPKRKLAEIDVKSLFCWDLILWKVCLSDNDFYEMHINGPNFSLVKSLIKLKRYILYNYQKCLE